MAKRSGNDMRRWAMIGAEQRLLQIARETAEIHAAFPELRQGGRGRAAAGPAGAAGSRRAASGKRGRKRRKLSAEGRRRISEAQKARWAKQKAGKK